MASDAGAPCERDAGAPCERDAGAPRRLDDPNAWAPVAASDDPFRPWARQPVTCSPVAGYYAEGSWLEVDTTRCNYVTLSQALRAPLAAGDIIELEVVHFDLSAPEPTRGCIGFSVGGEAPTVQSVAIPALAGTVQVSAVLGADAAVGARLFVHVQNHGQNTWRILALRQL